MIKDAHYLDSNFELSEKKHSYGKNIHLLNAPFHEKLLARFCTESVVQPEANRLVRSLSEFLLAQAVNFLFPRAKQKIKTRMSAMHSEAEFEAELLDEKTRVVVVDLMRAGILPSLVCYEALHEFLPAKNIRQDHILLNRKTNEKEEVIGVNMSGHKVGGPVEGAFVILADPMGATGSTICNMVNFYENELPKIYPAFSGKPLKFIALHFIVTPEYIKKVSTFSSSLEVFALRLDRGLSSPEILKTSLGEKWAQEKGLNEKHYIVPGAGGIGEILNNSFV
jgi:uracil phosphoribosyltransferase